MTTRPPFYITTPIYYVNSSPHVGHAYTTIACDAMARFKRLDGYDVHFLTGTDEHGQKVEAAARAGGMDPLTFADKFSAEFRHLAAAIDASNDDYIRTTEARHKAACIALWEKLVEKGAIYLGKYAGWYSVRDEAFYGEDEITLRPDGSRVAPTGAPLEWVEEPSYFFRLSDWQDKLLAFYDANPDFIAPQGRRNEVVSFVKQGLQDLSISRTTFSWGIPVPGAEGHVMYVWLDALTNYISALGYPNDPSGSMAKWWPAALHMVGKDILRFHAIYWPAFLMAADLAPPKRVFAHGWWTNEGEKISKSLGNVIDPFDLIARYGLDQTRYFLLREVPFGNDGDFSHRAMVQRMNTLANDYGNLLQRAASMIAKNCDGQVPEVGTPTGDDIALLDAARGLLPILRPLMDAQAFHQALEDIWVVVRLANGYFDRQAPWILRKSDPDRMATVLWVTVETVRHLAILTQPFMPGSSSRMLDQLGIPADARSFDRLGPVHALVSGTPLPAPAGVFPRYVEPATA